MSECSECNGYRLKVIGGSSDQGFHYIPCPTCGGSGVDETRKIGLIGQKHPFCDVCGGSGETKETELRVYVFRGTRPYGVHVVMARSLDAACKRVDVPVEKCAEWLSGVHAKYQYEVLEEGEVGDYGE